MSTPSETPITDAHHIDSRIDVEIARDMERVLEHAIKVGNEQNVALYYSRPISSLEVQAKYVALDKWKAAFRAYSELLKKYRP